MSLREMRRHVGRLAIVGFSGASAPVELGDIARRFDLGGVIYFARNVVEPLQVRELSREIAALAQAWPFWISVDQEGGRVARLKRPFTEWPPMQTLGRSGDEALARRFALALSAELRAVGVTLDYAPVLDVHTNPKNPVIGDRALSDKAEDVARLGCVIIEALQGQGIAACGKHFPGHGDTSVDSHHDLPVVDYGPDRLDAIELVPFRAAVAAGVAAIMTAHVLLPAFDETRPASLASSVITGLLKQKMGYQGVVMSDDLGMKAVAATTPLPEATIAAIEAGCDVVLLCNSTPDAQVEALESVIGAMESGRLSVARIEDAFRRQERVKAAIRASGPVDPDPMARIGCDQHQAVSQAMAAWL
jgi:beta-N-acetylhexosaminidase